MTVPRDFPTELYGIPIEKPRFFVEGYGIRNCPIYRCDGQLAEVWSSISHDGITHPGSLLYWECRKCKVRVKP